MKEFACSYRYGGRVYGFTLLAADFADASWRMRAIGMTGQVDGELVAAIPVPAEAFSIIRRFIAWLRGHR